MSIIKTCFYQVNILFCYFSRFLECYHELYASYKKMTS
nr:MAG TPA: hypothetical protein [Caudoviricetes sp.]